MAILLGWVIVSGAPTVLPVTVLGCAPSANEPWLHHKYGDAYRAYCDRVPRFQAARANPVAPSCPTL